VILVDTSVWIDHLRTADAVLGRLLEENRVLTHPFVIGELAIGHLKPRASVLRELQDLPQALTARDDEGLDFVERERLFGLGLGYIDAHLLASVRLTPGSTLWTRDRQFMAVAARLAVNAKILH
jgi:predicted nucleic acid-binding protein